MSRESHQIPQNNSYNNFNNEKIKEVSRDGRIKKYTNKSCRDDNKQNAPYTLFSSNRVSMKEYVGMHFIENNEDSLWTT